MIALPSRVFEPHLVNFLERLWSDPEAGELALDFSAVQYYIPAAIAALLARADFAVQNGLPVRVHGLDQCQNRRYLQRIDFFEQLGIPLEEDFVRHDPKQNFVPIQEVTPALVTFRTNDTATRLAECVAGADSGDVFQLAEYALGEIIDNVCQHAGRRGFASGQYTPKTDMTRIAIADAGIGILESFRQSGSPRYREGMTHTQILELALSAWSSSKAHMKNQYGEPMNRGVGLTMTRFMVAESYGPFFIASGNAWWSRNGLADERMGQFRDGIQIAGTMVSAGFRRDQVDEYGQLRQQAWKALGLTSAPGTDSLFT